MVTLDLLGTTWHSNYRHTSAVGGRLWSWNRSSCCCWRCFVVVCGCRSF